MSAKAMQSIVDMNAEELAAHETELREELFQMRFKNAMRQLDNPLKIRALRRQIARVRTLMARPATTAAKTAAPAPKTAKRAAKEKTR